MKPELIDFLIEIAKKRGRVTTSRIARDLGSSQQTVSRKIRELEKSGLVSRTRHQRGQLITLTESGRKMMRRRYLELKNAVEGLRSEGISFGGNVISGSGEGAYYVGQDEYFIQFHEKLGFRPYLGTLNVHLKSTQDMKAKNETEKTRPVIVKGFRKKNRTFGDIRCYTCVVNRKVKGAVIIPERTHHPQDIIEVISPANLRKELSLKDNDYVHIGVRT